MVKAALLTEQTRLMPKGVMGLAPVNVTPRARALRILLATANKAEMCILVIFIIPDGCAISAAWTLAALICSPVAELSSVFEGNVKNGIA